MKRNQESIEALQLGVKAIEFLLNSSILYILV